MNRMRPALDLFSGASNPFMGMVAYAEYVCSLHNQQPDSPKARGCVNASLPEAFFERLDEMRGKGLPCNILYLRLGWSWFEPREGVYAWRDSASPLARYIRGARERRLQVAFRVLTGDHYDRENRGLTSTRQTLPPWLFTKPGFTFYRNSEGSPCPHYDNPVYLAHYERLVRELARDFDDPGLVAFVDAQGLGMWGEMHELRTRRPFGVNRAVLNHARIWTRHFHQVLLGACFGGSVDRINRRRVVPRHRHMVRRDGYGSRWITPAFEKAYLQGMLPNRVPSYGEMCYWHLNDYEALKQHFDVEPELAFTGDREQDLSRYFALVMDQAARFRVNTLDVRVPGDWAAWLAYGREQLARFEQEGGYRLAPEEIAWPERVPAGQQLTVRHVWRNHGFGFFPDHDNQLSGRYRIALALVDGDGQLHETTLANHHSLAWRREEGPQHLETAIPLHLPPGDYQLAVAIVDTRQGLRPALNLCVDLPKLNMPPDAWHGAWYLAGSVTVATSY